VSRAKRAEKDRLVVSLAVDLAPGNPRELRLANPIIAASGCLGYGTEDANVVDTSRLGAFVAKTVTLRSRTGNPLPRLTETPAGVLAAVGLQNPGLDVFLRRYPPFWAMLPFPAIASIGGESVHEYAEIARALDEASGVVAIEVNLSCCPAETPDFCFGWDADLAASVVEAVRAATSLAVIAKLGPGPVDIVEVALAAEGAGADAISLINSVVGLAIDVQRRRPMLASRRGGLSGPAIKPIAVSAVAEVAAAVTVPVVGGGGIANLDDVLEFLMAGATAVQVGTAIFTEPGILVRLVEELEAWMIGHGVARLEEIVGVARGDGGGDERGTLAQPWAVAAG
jgi:dihydroorotate dehydrogenase (NAD+) catalytic subunit